MDRCVFGKDIVARIAASKSGHGGVVELVGSGVRFAADLLQITANSSKRRGSFRRQISGRCGRAGGECDGRDERRIRRSPTLRPGDRVRWSRYTGTVQRVVDDVAEILQNGRNTLWDCRWRS